MDLEARLFDHPELLLPLWGLGGRDRSRDRHARWKAGFWSGVLAPRRRLDQGLDRRAAVPPNLLRAERIAASAEEAQRRGEREPHADFEARLKTFKARSRGMLRVIREIEPPADLEGKMEECTPQFSLRPIPRLEKDEDDKVEMERRPVSLHRAQDDLEDLRRDLLRSLRPELLRTWNMDVLVAHRRFHNGLLHRTDWTLYLSRDRLESKDLTLDGPSWAWRRWERWDPLLDPVPHEDRPKESGYLRGDTLIPL